MVTARSHNASVFNPALLADRDPHRQTRLHIHSYAGARLLDRDNFLATVDDFQQRYEGVNLEDLLGEGIDLAPTEYSSSEALRRATRNIRQVQTDINHLGGKPLRVSAAYGFSASYPMERWAIGGYRREFVVLGSMVRVADEDNAAIDRVTNTVDRFADLLDQVISVRDEVNGDATLTLSEVIDRAQGVWNAALALNEYLDFSALRDDIRNDAVSGKNIQDYLRDPLPETFYTSIDSRGAEVTEQAISLARSFSGGSALPGQVQVGINFKQVDFTTIDFSQRVDEFSLSAYENPQYRRFYRRFNMDLGLVYDPSQVIQMGLVVRNLIPRDYQTVAGELIESRPVARLGVGYRRRDLRLSLDIDLTRNEPLGFDPDKQYIGLGAEWFLWRNTAVRAGIRTNMVDGETLPSLGVGLGGNRGHFDLAFAKSANSDEWALGIQGGLAF